VFIGKTIGYPIPYATQYTNPQQALNPNYSSSAVIAQADPNGLFSPTAAAGTWLMLIDPKGKPVPGYYEPDVVCLPYKIPANELVFVPNGY
jgi:hypothetical protein